MAQKFTVVVEAFLTGLDGNPEGFVEVIYNRAGRKWVSNDVEACPGDAAEHAMVLEEMLNGGVKINPNHWTEYLA